MAWGPQGMWLLVQDALCALQPTCKLGLQHVYSMDPRGLGSWALSLQIPRPVLEGLSELAMPHVGSGPSVSAGMATQLVPDLWPRSCLFTHLRC